MSTDIAGDLGEAQLVDAHNEIQTVFNGQIPGYFNGKRAKYSLESGVSKDGNYIYLDANCYGDLKDFFEPEKLKYWERYYTRYNRSTDRFERSNHLLQDSIGRAFPYHGIVLLNDSLYFMRRDISRKRILKGLEKLDYTIEGKKDTAFAHNWGSETKRELLKAIRRRGIVDPRIQKIVDILRENIGADSYTFAHYKPGARLHLTFGGYKEIVKTGHKKVDRVFELTEERLEPFQGFYTCDFSIYGAHPAVKTAAGIASPVQTRQGKRHIPMIDFRDRARLEDVEFDLARLNIPGMVVESGNSFHFYGFETLSQDDWRNFIEESRSLRSVDKNWPDLQLEQGYSMLRITPAYHRLFQPCIVQTRPKASGETQNTQSLKLAA